MKICVLLILTLSCYFVHAHSMEDPFPYQMSLHHTEGSGLGYSIGYTSLDLFVSKSVWDRNLTSFLDVRGHLFNNGKYAANAGGGVRYLNECFDQIWGINAFYDYLQTKRLNYHQVSFGLEVSGNQWDVFVNGYVPVGHKTKNIYEFSYNFSIADSHNKKTRIPGFLLKAKEQFAMTGVDTLIRYRFCLNDDFNIRIGLGPYLYWGTSAKTVNAFYKTHKRALGAQLRADLSYLNYISLETIVSYDTYFNWNGQATIILNIPLDLIFDPPSCTPCHHLRNKMFRPVTRNEIIVIDSHTRRSTNPNVLDPEHPPL